MAKQITKSELGSVEDIDLREPPVDEERLRIARERMVYRIRVLWTKRKRLIKVAGIGVITATLIAVLIPKRFQSTAKLMPPDQSSDEGTAMLAALAGGAGDGLGSMAAGMLGIKTTSDLFIGILESDTVRDDLIQKFNLRKIYHDRYIEDCRNDLTKHTDISADSKSGIIAVSVVDHDPYRAAAMAQEYITELNWVVNHLSTSSAHRERIFLDQRLAQVKDDLEASERQFGQFASQKGAIDIPTQGKAMVEAAATLQGQLIAAESELQSLRQIYTDNNTRVRSLQARVNELRTSLQRLGGANATESTSAEDLYPSLRELPLLGVKYADLLRRTKVEEAVFQTLTQRDELAKVQEAKEIPSVKILDPPDIPQKKSFPPRLIIICLGGGLALSFAIIWTLATESWVATDSADIRKVLAVQVWNDVRASLSWAAKNGNGALASSSTSSQQKADHAEGDSRHEDFASSDTNTAQR